MSYITRSLDARDNYRKSISHLFRSSGSTPPEPNPVIETALHEMMEIDCLYADTGSAETEIYIGAEKRGSYPVVFRAYRNSVPLSPGAIGWYTREELSLLLCWVRHFARQPGSRPIFGHITISRENGPSEYFPDPAWMEMGVDHPRITRKRSRGLVRATVLRELG